MPDVPREVWEFCDLVRPVVNRAIRGNEWPAEVEWTLDDCGAFQHLEIAAYAEELEQPEERFRRYANRHQDAWAALFGATAILLLNRDPYAGLDDQVRCATLRHVIEDMFDGITLDDAAPRAETAPRLTEWLLACGDITAYKFFAGPHPRVPEDGALSVWPHDPQSQYRPRPIRARLQGYCVRTQPYAIAADAFLTEAGFVRHTAGWGKRRAAVPAPEPPQQRFSIADIWGEDVVWVASTSVLGKKREAAQAPEWLRDVLIDVAQAFEKSPNGVYLARLERMTTIARLDMAAILVAMREHFPDTAWSEADIRRLERESRAIKKRIFDEYAE